MLLYFLENVHFNKSVLGQSESKDEESKRTEQQADHSFPASPAPQDGPWFLGLLNDCKAGIQLHIDRYEAVLAASEVSSEEIIGKIRATMGKANLLMNKKLNQFNKLCQDSIVSFMRSRSFPSFTLFANCIIFKGSRRGARVQNKARRLTGVLGYGYYSGGGSQRCF